LAGSQALGNLGLGSQQVSTQAAQAAAGISSQDYAREKAAQQANIGAAIALATLGAGGAMGLAPGGATGLQGIFSGITGGALQ
jgi:hypothetical protein